MNVPWFIQYTFSQCGNKHDPLFSLHITEFPQGRPLSIPILHLKTMAKTTACNYFSPMSFPNVFSFIAIEAAPINDMMYYQFIISFYRSVNGFKSHYLFFSVCSEWYCTVARTLTPIILYLCPFVDSIFSFFNESKETYWQNEATVKTRASREFSWFCIMFAWCMCL